MGFSFRRMFRNPVSLWNPVAGGFSEFDPGPNGRDTPDQYGPSPSPYGPGVQWDSQGYPVGPMPRGGQMPLEYQYEANRRTEQRRQALWGDAHNTMRQGLDLLQSYRPGGSAALASGMYGQQAGLYGTQAQTLESPDLLIDYRRDAQAKADIEAKRAARFSQIMGVLQLGAQVAGAGMGGAAGAAAVGGGQMANAAIGTPMAGGQTMLGPGPGTTNQQGAGIQPMAPYGGPMAAPATLPMPGAPGQPGMRDWTPQEQQDFGEGYGGAMQGAFGGGGGAGAGGGGGAPKRRGATGPGGGAGAPAPGPAGGADGGGAMGMPAGVGADGIFTQTALAASGAQSSPWLTPALQQEWSEDEGRRAKTAMMVMAATQELTLSF